jgi:RNA polymerase primary sigma factor
MAAYLLEIQRFPLLTPEKELDVASRFRQDQKEADLHRLVQSNLRFVVKIAKEYAGGVLPLEDLVSEGNLGLLRAARRFDPARGNRFLSCAVWWIRKAILDALESRGALIRVPRHQIRKVRQAGALGAELSTRLGRRADREEVSRALGVKLRDLEDTQVQVRKVISLDAPVSEAKKTSLKDFLPDLRTDNPEQALFRQEDRVRVRRAIRRLDVREHQVLSERFGLGSRGGRTLQEVGEKLGISREMVRQIEARAREKLLRALLRDGSLSGDASLRAVERAASFSCRAKRQRRARRRVAAPTPLHSVPAKALDGPAPDYPSAATFSTSSTTRMA